MALGSSAGLRPRGFPENAQMTPNTKNNNLVPRVLSLLRESTLVAAGHVSARFLQIPEMWLKGGAGQSKFFSCT